MIMVHIIVVSLGIKQEFIDYFSKCHECFYICNEAKI